MNKAKEAAMLMSSLSVYRGILKRTVPAAFHELLCAIDRSLEIFLKAWGNFVGVLSERGYADSWAKCIGETALFDENVFSVAAAAGKVKELTPQTLEAVRRDILAIDHIGKITPEDIISAYKDARMRSLSPESDLLAEFSDQLPVWEVGETISQLANAPEELKPLADYYKKHGCGMYARYRAFLWRNGSIEPVVYPDPIKPDSLKGYERERNIVVENTTAFLNGVICNNCLLYGDRGTGKSSTVKAILNRYYTEGLRMVELPKDRLGDFPLLVEKIAAVPLKFIIFIDDLSFSSEDKSYAQLKAVLEGGLAARPENTLIYATSNRRHLIKETFSDRDGDDMHRNDSMQETLSLSDRFGLAVNFSKPGKDEYLNIVVELAKEYGLEKDEEELKMAAEEWAISRGGRSPRCARQFISAASAGLI